MTLLGEILLEHYAGASDYAGLAVVAAVEELEKHADDQPELVRRVEMAMFQAGNVGVPHRLLDEFVELDRQMRAAGESR